MVKRKLNGAVNESSANRKIRKWEATVHTVTCEKSGGLHLAEPSITAGWQVGWLAGRPAG